MNIGHVKPGPFSFRSFQAQSPIAPIRHAAGALPEGPRRVIRTFAIGLSLTRVVVLAHWASDVVAGFALGIVLERTLRLWTGYPAVKEGDYADS